MGDGPCIGYIKGFHVSRRSKDRNSRNIDRIALDALHALGERLENGEEADIELPNVEGFENFFEDFKKLPHYELIWSQAETSSCSIGDHGGGAMGWHWKKQGGWEGHNATDEDLAKLKKFLKKYGYEVGRRIEDDIYAYIG